MSSEVPREQRSELTALYLAFNARDILTVLKSLSPEVVWPNGWEGGTVHGHQEVRDYWTRQWAEIDPIVTPVGFTTMADGRIAVQVHQVVCALDGTTITDGRVTHLYRLHDGLVAEMEIRAFPQLSDG